MQIHVQFDSGSPNSILKLSVARRAGFRADDPAVTPGGGLAGVSGRYIQTWIAPFKSFAIGDEQVQNTRLRVGDFESDDVDMILGADFFLSHRIFVAKSQSRLYFTYNGGPVFDLSAKHAGPQTGATSATAAPAAAGDGAPKDAAGFVRRGQAFLSRNQYDKAIADFSRAVALEPKNPDYLHERAMARWDAGALDGARQDLDAALKLKPGDADYLIQRGRLRLATKDDSGARADFDAAEAADPKQRSAVAVAYEVYERYPAAIAEFDRLVAQKGSDDDLAAALNGRCWARALWGQQLDAALADCDAALKLGPHVADFLDSRGLVELRMGQYARSVTDYSAALRTMRQSTWTLYGRGLAEQKLGQTAKARADMAAATALEPDLPGRWKELGIAP